MAFAEIWGFGKCHRGIGWYWMPWKPFRSAVLWELWESLEVRRRLWKPWKSVEVFFAFVGLPVIYWLRFVNSSHPAEHIGPGAMSLEPWVM